MQLEAIHLHLQQDHVEQATAIVAQAQKRARGALAGARSAIDNLRSAPADLSAAIDEEIDRFTTATGIACHVERSPVRYHPVCGYEQLVYAVTEALANVARHAQASHVWITINASNQVVEVIVRDDGVGFEPVISSSQAGHYGLLGLRERARLACGEFSIQSTTGAGSTLRFCVPQMSQEATDD